MKTLEIKIRPDKTEGIFYSVLSVLLFAILIFCSIALWNESNLWFVGFATTLTFIIFFEGIRLLKRKRIVKNVISYKERKEK